MQLQQVSGAGAAGAVRAADSAGEGGGEGGLDACRHNCFKAHDYHVLVRFIIAFLRLSAPCAICDIEVGRGLELHHKQGFSQLYPRTA